MKDIFIGFCVGLVLAIVGITWQFCKRKASEKSQNSEIKKLKDMLSQRMELESEGLAQVKKENEQLKKVNENLRITNSNLMQKPGKAEVQRLQIYQKAVDRLTINSPGFGPAWQSALKESEEEFKEIYTGTQAFIKKVLPSKTNAKLLKDIVDEQ